jgi:hypothetical protein
MFFQFKTLIQTRSYYSLFADKHAILRIMHRVSRLIEKLDLNLQYEQDNKIRLD